MSCSDVLGVWLVTDAVCHPSAVKSELGLLLLLHSPSSLQCDPALLPEPNHVMLNHLYALSIKVRGARACPTHGKLGCLTVAHAHLFSLPCRMEWWCLVLHTVTRRNTWPLCCTSQYEHHSYLWPIVLGQCSLRKKMLHLTKCTSALCCSKWTLISYCSWDFQVLLYFPYFVSPTLEVLGNGSFTATRQVAKVSVPLVSSVKKPPI